MFAYCENNPVNFVDSEGLAPKNLEGYVKKLTKKTVFGTKGLKLTVKGNSITISVDFKFYGDLYNKKLRDVTYKRLFLNGVAKYWSGKFNVFGYKNVSLKVQFITVLNNQVSVFTRNRLGVSNVSWWLGGWSIVNHGKITIYRGDSRANLYYSKNEFERVAAHEFGHILGLDDLYNKPKRIINKYSIKGNYSMMGHQWKASHVNNHDVRKILTAFMYNKFQSWY